jgi:predicted short-subunit dehydrogenase-like oxidoreductase (DUF2520 family)
LQPTNKIRIVGTGKLAESLLMLFNQHSEHEVILVGRNAERVSELQSKFGLSANDDPSLISPILLCVPDAHIGNVAQTWVDQASLFVHFSGATSIDVLPKTSGGNAVCWPAQSFGDPASVVWKDVPMFTESDGEKGAQFLVSFLKITEAQSFALTSADRQKMHMTAVFMNNFVNHLAFTARQYCLKNDLPFEALLPLMEKTVSMARYPGPDIAQTGPARRNDQRTMQIHKDLIGDNPEMIEIYEMLSKQIIQRYI